MSKSVAQLLYGPILVYVEINSVFRCRHICLTYDGGKDLYKVFVDGVKVESGSWAGERQLEPARKGGLTYLGQDQDSLAGDFNPRQGAALRYCHHQ